MSDSVFDVNEIAVVIARAVVENNGEPDPEVLGQAVVAWLDEHVREYGDECSTGYEIEPDMVDERNHPGHHYHARVGYCDNPTFKSYRIVHRRISMDEALLNEIDRRAGANYPLYAAARRDIVDLIAEVRRLQFECDERSDETTDAIKCAKAAEVEVARLQQVITEIKAQRPEIVDAMVWQKRRAEKAEAQRDGWRQMATQLAAALQQSHKAVGYHIPSTRLNEHGFRGRSPAADWMTDIVDPALAQFDRLVAEQETE